MKKKQRGFKMGNIGKRFTDPSIWERPFFSELTTEMRLFWLFINARCDLSGVYQLHFPVDSAYCGFTIDRDFIKAFIESVNDEKKRVEALPEQKLWLTEFLRYQQCKDPEGSLSAAKNAGAHKKAVKLLKEHGVFDKAVKADPVLFKEYTGESLSRGTQDPPDTHSIGTRVPYSSSNSSDNGVDRGSDRHSIKKQNDSLEFEKSQNNQKMHQRLGFTDEEIEELPFNR